MKEKVKEKREVLFGGNRKDATEFDGKGFWLKISQDFFLFIHTLFPPLFAHFVPRF